MIDWDTNAAIHFATPRRVALTIERAGVVIATAYRVGDQLEFTWHISMWHLTNEQLETIEVAACDGRRFVSIWDEDDNETVLRIWRT